MSGLARFRIRMICDGAARFWGRLMILTEAEISSRLAADFSGRLLFQPIDVGSDTGARPVALLASVAQLLPAPVQSRQATTHHPMFDLLHHDPAAMRQKR